jgi:ComF family protein
MIWSSILEFFYPEQCALCASLGQDAICPNCQSEMQKVAAPIYFPSHSGLSTAHALFTYESRAAQAVRRLKYSRSLALAQPMAELIRSKWEEIGANDFDLVIPVPIHWSRWSARGFNQAELLCSCLPEKKVKPSLLSRTKRTKPQVSLSATERRKILADAFAPGGSLDGAKVLLVDDVITTGGTATACAAALRRAGASRVEALAFCGEKLAEA